MTKDKKIRILIEMPEKWVDLESPLGLLSGTIYRIVERQVVNVLAEEYVKKIKMPKITITGREVKDRMLTILAERALEDRE